MNHLIDMESRPGRPEPRERMTRILVIEDSPTQAEELRLIFEDAGYEVETAPSGEVGIERLHGAAFDLAISDVLMPGIDGYELCRRVKAEPSLARLPIILFTSLGDPLDVIRALECGADNFMTKPCEPEYLLARVRSILESRRLRTRRRSRADIDILFLERTFTIASEKEQILDLLVSTFEDMVRKNQELQESRQRLEAANRELEAFSYSVAHDLGAPLRAIDGFSRLLLKESGGSLVPRGRQHLERVLETTTRMRQTIDDLMRLSYVVKADLAGEDIDLSALAQIVGTSLTAIEPERQVELVIEPGLRCRGDAGLVRVLLDNLLGNAWKFTRKRRDARVEVAAQHGNGEVVFRIGDNGEGFEMTYAHKLFLPFERLHSSAEFAGTGIGLTTARRIVQRHGGRIWAESRAGQGATFYFTLPGPRGRARAAGARAGS